MSEARADYPRDQPVAGERRWVLVFAGLVMLLTTLPFLLGYARQGQEWVFTGFVFGVEDGNSYLAKMLSGTAGAWLFRSPYTPYPQGGVIAFLPYLLLGKLASPPGLHEQVVALFHLFRLLAGTLAILATYDWMALFLHDIRLRRFGLVLGTLGGGLGWVLVLAGRQDWLGSLPLEFYSPEAFGFLGLYGLPHLALARAALLWGLVSYLRGPALRQGGIKIGLLGLLAALAQPLAALLFVGVIILHVLSTAVWLGIKGPLSPTPGKGWQAWRKTLLLAGASALLPACFLLYTFFAFRNDPFLKAWTAQNLIISPHPLHYLLAYGLLLPFALAGARRLLQVRPWEGLPLVGWVLAVPFLLYAPFNLQRRLAEGVWVVWVVLALAAMDGREGIRWSRAGKFSLPLFSLALPSTFILLAGGILAASQPSLPVFRPAGEVAAFRYLQENAQAGEVILTSYETGNALPAWAPVRVVIGHGPESANLAGLRPRVAAFFSAAAPEEERLDLLREFGIRYLFWGPGERNLRDWDPNQSPGWESVYKSGEYQVFEKTNLP